MSLGGIGRILGLGGGTSQPVDPILQKVAAGGARFERLVLTQNRRVMASVTDGGRTLRLSRALADAPGDVLAALGSALSARLSAARARARSAVRRHLGSRPGTSRPESRPHVRRVPTADRPRIERLRREFARVNEGHFGGRLPEIALRLSGRMRRRNGHFSADPLEIAISRRLFADAVEGEAERTLRHEMIHLWQWLEGRKPGHGADFRRWARRLDIHPRATRDVCWNDAA
ncbi:MAG TPA: SprT-like domain-containing protein [Longimicrobiaceae bacterium]|nr:SprT-like domain-containing protein [Longimicrobiaceae bacterium]